MPEQLQTDRLTVRALRSEDAPALHGFFGDAKANRYFDVPHTSLAQTIMWVDRAVAAASPTNREMVLLLDGQVIGRAAIWQAPEIGYFLCRRYWGRGYMQEALRCLLPHFFAEMRLAEIRADVDPRNAASLNLLERLGFRETGRATRTIQIGDEWCDSVYLTCPASRWT